jgi:hypothetical protein
VFANDIAAAQRGKTDIITSAFSGMAFAGINGMIF